MSTPDRSLVCIPVTSVQVYNQAIGTPERGDIRSKIQSWVLLALISNPFGNERAVKSPVFGHLQVSCSSAVPAFDRDITFSPWKYSEQHEPASYVFEVYSDTRVFVTNVTGWEHCMEAMLSTWYSTIIPCSVDLKSISTFSFAVI